MIISKSPNATPDSAVVVGESFGQPLVSVLMNCYNGEKYLREAIESVLAQTYRNWELVFWDNQSTDSSVAIVQSYNDTRIRIFKALRHTNLAPARRLAVQCSRGQYVCFLDCDDIYFPDNISMKLDWMLRKNAAAAYGGVVSVDEDGIERGRSLPTEKSGMILDSLLKQFDAHISTLIVSRAAMERCGINFSDDIVGSTEYDLLMQIAATELCVTIPLYLARIRHHPDSLTYTLIGDWASDRNRTLRRIRERIPGIESRHIGGFSEAYARADYYHARWLVAAGRRADALVCLRSIATKGWRYLAVYVALAISTSAWDFVHRRLPSSRQF